MFNMKLDSTYPPPEKMWTPSDDNTQMDAFRCQINKKYKTAHVSYNDLWIWSVENYSSFWEEFFHFSRIKFSKCYDEVVDESKGIAEIPVWFRGSLLNYAENLLNGDRNDVALYEAGEGKKLQKITFGQLLESVRLIASAMKHCGVQAGDRVVGYIPNCALAVEAMLATASLGAVWSSTSPEFGVAGVLDRFQQIKPKLIFSVDAVMYNGKVHDHLQKLCSVVCGLPELEKVVVLPYMSMEKDIDISDIPNSVFLSTFLDLADKSAPLEYVQVPFHHPLFIMYSSGTTGPPKCMVHSVGGTLIQHLKEHVLHGDMKKTDVMLYYTTTGWMMWNWMLSSLAIGSAVILYDGSPLLPTANVLWDLVDEIGITILGTGARWIEALEERGVHPMRTHKLESLHTILSTGSPLKPASYDYVYASIKKDIMLGSISGGTDIISCFVGQNKTLHVYKGEVQCRNLGMAVESWTENGLPVYDQSGELVCTKPFPSMPTYFWNDPDGHKYKKSYFCKFEGVWAHGDFCQISSSTGGIVMLGRSDGTLNPSGVRFGSAEIYNVVSSANFREISDSLCVGQNTNQGERVILFLKMKDGLRLDGDLVDRVKAAIRTQLSARHVPSIILPTLDIPYTTSGKKVEVAVKRILNGESVTHRGALINPDSLDLYYGIPELS